MISNWLYLMPVDKHWLYKVAVYSVARHFIYLCLLTSLRAGRFKYSEGLTWYPISLTELAWASALKTCCRLIWHFFYTALLCGCLSRKHCWKRKSKQNPYAATQFVNLSLYAQLLMSSEHIGQTLSLSLKPAQPRPPAYQRGRATIPCPLTRFEKMPDYHHPSFI